MLDMDVVIHTDVNVDIKADLPENKDINTNLPESTALMINSQKDHERPYFNLSAWPILDKDVVIHTDVNVDIKADLPENSAPMMNSDLILFELNDVTRREVLGSLTADNMSSRGIDDRLVLPEDVSLNTTDMFLDPVRSVGPRRWSMCMDMEDQLDTINGVPMYDGRDMRGSADTEESEPDVPEGKEFTILTHSHSDGRETRSLDVIDMRCRTVLGNGPENPDEELDIAGLCRCPEIEEGALRY